MTSASPGNCSCAVTFDRVIEPTGPLPPSVYWRRRALAFGGCAVAAVVVVWLVAAYAGDSAAVDDVPPAAASVPPAPAEPPVAVTSSSTTSAPSPSPTLPPGPPPPCLDAQITVVAESDKSTYRTGEQPLFKIVVSNSGPFPCTKDIGRRLRELVVSSADGSTRLWSSNDCYATAGTEVRVLQPGERFGYALRWLGTRSEPGCRMHTPLGPGDYLLTAKVAGKASTPVVFRLT
jgi:hypothetical protein